jgi:M6 family metalloprotease-like protein
MSIKIKTFLKLFTAAVFAGVFFVSSAFGVPANPAPAEITQPDGTKLTIVLRGDEFFNWVEDINGFTLLQNSAGFLTYAKEQPDGTLAPSENIAGITNPTGLGLTKHLRSRRALYAAAQQRTAFDRDISAIRAERKAAARAAVQTRAKEANQITGKPASPMVNIVILAEFSDVKFNINRVGTNHAEIINAFDNLYNQQGYRGPDSTAYGSVKDYFKEVSYNQFVLNTVIVTPIITLPNPITDYSYRTGDDNQYVRARQMVLDILDILPSAGFNFSSVVPSGSTVDITVIHANYGAEYADTPANRYNRIWSHQWYVNQVSGGVNIRNYNMVPAMRGISGKNITHIGVLCHEFGHVIGLPDLYDIGSISPKSGLGNMCLMSGGNWVGSSGQQGNVPVHMSAWAKYDMGWSAPVINPADASNISIQEAVSNKNAFYIFTLSTDTYGEPEEFFIMENRQGPAASFDAYLVGGAASQRGILMYHVDEKMSGSNSSDDAHYHVRMMEAIGGYPLSTSAGLSGNTNYYFRENNSQNMISDAGTNGAFGVNTTPNTVSYNGTTRLTRTIAGITAAGSGTMQFSLNSEELELTDVTPQSAFAGSSVTFNVTGKFLSNNLTAQLKRGTSVINHSGISYVSDEEINVTFNIPATVVAGADWDLSVTNTVFLQTATIDIEILPAPQITSVTPNIILPGTSEVITVKGVSLISGVSNSLILRSPGRADIAATGVTVVDSSTVTGTFVAPSDINHSRWSITFSNGANSVTKDNAIFIGASVVTDTVPKATGGVLEFAIQEVDGIGALSVAPNTFISDVTITITDITGTTDTWYTNPKSNVGVFIPSGTGVAVDILPGSAQPQPGKTVLLEMPFPATGFTGIDTSTLVIARYDERAGIWVPYKTRVDTANFQVSANVDHFSVYQIMGSTGGGSLSAVKYYPNPVMPNKDARLSRLTLTGVPVGTTIKIYNVMARLVRTITAGSSQIVTWDAKNESGALVASGVYFIKIESGSDTRTIKVAIER